mmetsp:Transcript_43275/g.110133  ORF Transcript_43275/g.110133 Transcript_43275/m.110133 type:complete len:215 (-) Transcript_43275:311-955(-)
MAFAAQASLRRGFWRPSAAPWLGLPVGQTTSAGSAMVWKISAVPSSVRQPLVSRKTSWTPCAQSSRSWSWRSNASTRSPCATSGQAPHLPWCGRSLRTRWRRSGRQSDGRQAIVSTRCTSGSGTRPWTTVGRWQRPASSTGTSSPPCARRFAGDRPPAITSRRRSVAVPPPPRRRQRCRCSPRRSRRAAGRSLRARTTGRGSCGAPARGSCSAS